ncbi:UPF0692 protein C19orf54 -like protein [Triplophysa tibetana]|uniref:Actin maturation protease n=1 Tax=Triplophysa tibetana TaxID=1572043 RepID=A0A5A9P278_9TELE|nr:UPF0692 protein C19orf54 -like protein [Triplophysa tibetana]
MSAQKLAAPPPPPLPPPLSLTPSGSSKKKLYQAIAKGKSPVEGDYEEAKIIIGQRQSSFRKDVQWLLFNKYVPSLIQDGPQCGLVALWMAAHLLQPPKIVSMETVVQTAKDKGYTAQGEMFSGTLLGLSQGCVDGKLFSSDIMLPWLHLSHNGACVSWPTDLIEEVYVLAKQGKSLRYQLWKFETVAQSNTQLEEMDPQRVNDGTYYVLPSGGVQEGLAGQVVLLHTNHS